MTGTVMTNISLAVFAAVAVAVLLAAGVAGWRRRRAERAVARQLMAEADDDLTALADVVYPPATVAEDADDRFDPDDDDAHRAAIDDLDEWPAQIATPAQSRAAALDPKGLARDGARANVRGPLRQGIERQDAEPDDPAWMLVPDVGLSDYDDQADVGPFPDGDAEAGEGR